MAHCEPGFHGKSWKVRISPAQSWGIGSYTASADCMWYKKSAAVGQPATLTITEDRVMVGLRNDAYGETKEFCVSDLVSLEEQEIGMETVQLRFSLKTGAHEWLRFEKTNKYGTGFQDKHLHKVFRLPDQQVKPFPEEWKKELKVVA